MTYPPQPGGYDPYGQQQPGYGQQPSGPPYHHDPKTSVPSSPAGGYPQPAYPQPGYAQPAYAGPTGPAGPPPDPGERPQKATIGSMSMVGNAVLWMFAALMGVIFANQFSSNVEDWCNDLSGGDDTSSYSSASSCADTMDMGGAQVVSSFFNFVWLLAFVLIALFALRGFNWARITSFVLNGISIAWNLMVMICLGLSLAALSSASSSYSATTSSSSSIDDIIPGWYLPSAIVVGLLSVAISALGLFMMGNREAGDWYKANTAARAAGVI